MTRCTASVLVTLTHSILWTQAFARPAASPSPLPLEVATLLFPNVPVDNMTEICDKLRASGTFTCTNVWGDGAVGKASVGEGFDKVRSMLKELGKQGESWTVTDDSPLIVPVYDYIVDSTPKSFTGRFSFENSIRLFTDKNTTDNKKSGDLSATLRAPRRSQRVPSRVNVAGSALDQKAKDAAGVRRAQSSVTDNLPLDQLRIADDFAQGNETSTTLVVQHGTPDLGALSAYAGGCLRTCRSPNNFYFAAAGSNVTVYVIDTPVADHVQFKQVQTGESRLAVEEFVSVAAANATGACARDFGTHAAASVAGFEFGTAKDADIVSVGVRPGCGGTGQVSDLLAGLSWIRDHHQANVSPGAAIALVPFAINAQDPASDAVKRSIQDLIGKGVSFAVAAGDVHKDACDYVPANMQNVITVGGVAVDAASLTAKPWAWTNFDKCVDVFAPAVQVRSASSECFECTASLSRTGTAAARVAGIMAQFIQTNSNASSATVKAAVIDGSTNQFIQSPPFPYRQTTRSVAQSLLNLDVFEVRDVV